MQNRLRIVAFSESCYPHIRWNNCRNCITMGQYISLNFPTCSCMQTWKITLRWKCSALYNCLLKSYAKPYTMCSFISTGILRSTKDKLNSKLAHRTAVSFISKLRLTHNGIEKEIIFYLLTCFVSITLSILWRNLYKILVLFLFNR